MPDVSFFTTETPVKLSVKDLVAKACQLAVSAVNAHAVTRMIQKYSISVDIALRCDDFTLLANLYEDALKLPSVETSLELEQNGFMLDRVLINSNDSLQICFKKSVPYVLKVCTSHEYERALIFEDVLKTEPCKYIISYELYSRNLKFFMLMPLHPVNLEHLPCQVSTTAPLFWNCMSSDLKYLHKHGYAHNDIKPLNILITTSGEFVLADLGSLVQFGCRSGSTKAYIPRELWNPQSNNGPCASIRVDYWMLAMTIFEKACGGVIRGAESPRQSTIRDAIQACSQCNGFSTELLSFLQ
jgi:serine/threonine protein kinase